MKTLSAKFTNIAMGHKPNIHPGEILLKNDAVLYLDSKFSEEGEPRVINQGTGGDALDAKYGSILGTYVYDGAASIPILANNHLSVPNDSDFRIVGEKEWVLRVNAPSWSDPYLISTSEPFVSGHEIVSVGGALWLVIFQPGQISLTCPTPHGFVDGETYWIKITHLANDGAGNHVTNFYKADDQETEPTSWTLIDTRTTAGSLTYPAITGNTQINKRTTSTGPAAINFYRYIIRDGIDGTTVLDVDLANVANYATSFTATTGQTVTVNSTSSDTNDPLFLPHTGENYLQTPGTDTDNGLNIPDEAAFDILDNLDVSARIALSSTGTVISRYDTGQIVFAFSVDNVYNIRALVYDQGAVNGGTIASTESLADNGYPLGSDVWIRFTFEAGIVKYWYAPPSADRPTSWTQLGDTQDYSASFTELHVGTSGINIGKRFNRLTGQGRIYRAIVKDGIDGTTVLDFNAATDITDSGATSLTLTSGQTATVTRSTSGRKTALVTRPVWLFGTDDNLRINDNALVDFNATDDFSVVAVRRMFATPSTWGRLISKSNTVSNSLGYAISTSSNTFAGYFSMGDGTNGGADVTATESAGQLRTLTMVVDRTAEELEGYTNNTPSGSPGSTALVGTLENPDPLFIGSATNFAQYFEGEIVAVAIFRRVLTTDEIALINEFFGTA